MSKEASVVLEFEGRRYAFDVPWSDDDYPDESLEFMFTDGNYSCDCNKSLFIARYCDGEASFDEMDCGDRIKLVRVGWKGAPPIVDEDKTK